MACSQPYSQPFGKPRTAGLQPLSNDLSSAFHAPATAGLVDSRRILRVIIDLPSTPEVALRVAQFARAHYDSISTIDAIEVRYEHEQRLGQISSTFMNRGGAFLPAMLPVDTSPGWVQLMLAAPATPALRVDRVRPVVDTFFANNGFSSILQVRDTTVGKHSLWRVATESRSTNGQTLAVDVVTLDKATLRPVEEQRNDASGTVTVRYDGGHVRIELTTNRGGHLSRDTTFATAPYSGSEFELLLPTLPLAEDYTTRLPIVRANSFVNGLDWVTVLVAGADTSRNAWVVEAAGTHTGFERRWISRAPSRLNPSS